MIISINISIKGMEVSETVPVDTRCRFNVCKTSIGRQQRGIDVL